MPYLYSHRYMGQQASLLAGENARMLIARHERAFFLGCQGPDIYFYHGTAGISKHSLRYLGRILHRENVGDWMKVILRLALEDEATMAYFMGYVCHYALDSHAHPYVYNNACSYDHTRFEVQLDMALLAHLQTPLKRLVPAKTFEVDEKTLSAVGALFGKAGLAMNLKEDMCEAYIRSYHIGIRIQKLLYDPYRIKRPLFYFVGALIGCPRIIAGKSHVRSKKDAAIDFLNVNHRRWCLPWDENTVSTASFLELIDKAALFAAPILDAIAGLNPQSDMAPCLALIGDNGFDTGINCKIERNIKNCKCLFCGKESQ